MDYNSAVNYETVNLVDELAKLETLNKDLVNRLNEEKAVIDMDVAMGNIDTVTAFMRYTGLTVKGVKMKKELNFL